MLNIQECMEKRRFVQSGIGMRTKTDEMCEQILSSKDDECNVILPEGFAFLLSYEKYRKAIIDKYNISAIYEMGNIFGSFSSRFLLYCFTTKKCNEVKFARFGTNIVEKDPVISEEAKSIYEKYRRGYDFTIEEQDILDQIDFPEFTDEYKQYLLQIAQWDISRRIPENSLNCRFFVEESSKVNFDTPAPKSNEKEELEFFEKLRKEAIIKLSDVADIKSSFRGRTEIHSLRKITFKDLNEESVDYKRLAVHEVHGIPTRLMKNDIIIPQLSVGEYKYFIIKEDMPEDVYIVNAIIVRATNMSAEYLYVYLQSERVQKYFYYLNYTMQLTIPSVHDLPVIVPCDEMIRQSALFFKCLYLKDSDAITDMINKILQINTVVPEEKPLQNVIERECLEKLRLFKVEMVSEILESDWNEMEKCFDAEAYKACIIICGSILETVLLDWLSEKEDTNYFVKDEDKSINLYQVIRRIKLLQKHPQWTKDKEADDVRLKRNLVHPVKIITEKPCIDRKMALSVIKETSDVLVSRGINGNIIPHHNR